MALKALDQRLASGAASPAPRSAVPGPSTSRPQTNGDAAPSKPVPPESEEGDVGAQGGR